MNYTPVRRPDPEQRELRAIWRLLLQVPGVAAAVRAWSRIPWRQIGYGVGVCSVAWSAGWWWRHHPGPRLVDGLLVVGVFGLLMFAAFAPREERASGQ